MKPRFAQLTAGGLIAVAALTACRKEVPLPLPAPDPLPKPTVQARYLASAGSAALWLGR